MNYDNPAARLVAILENGKKHPAASKCRAVWEELLDAQGNPSLLMTRLGKVMALPEQAILALRESFPEQGNVWSHWETQVTNAFMVQNLHATWESFTNHIDQHTLNYLKLSSSLLQEKANTKLIATSDLADVRKRLDDILRETISSEHPDEIKRYLARSLRHMIASIDEYRLTGALPLLEAAEALVGHAVTDTQYKSFLTDTELGKKLLDTLNAMACVVTVAVGMPQLGHAIAMLMS